MKKEWKPEELRQTSEEIRGATLAKSITPEMVGGTLSGLTEALAEVVDVLGEIPREHVRVKVRGYDGQGGVSGAGATVWLDVFHTKGYPCVSFPRQKLTADENGVVEFDVPHGFKYAVFSQIAGLGASFQIIGSAANTRHEINLWNMPIGVMAFGYSGICLDTDEASIYREVPFVTNRVSDDSSDYQQDAEWDIDTDKGEYSDVYDLMGILVSTADTSFAITPNSMSEERMTWCKARDYGTLVANINPINDKETGETWEECQNRARTDYDGNMNTAKILDFCHEPTAALFCGASDYMYTEQRFLPSAGQLAIMQLNNKQINAVMTALNNARGDTAYKLLPYTNDKGQWLFPNGNWEYWWSSTIYDEYCSWLVHYYGSINDFDRYNSYDVRAVSAFHFEY